MDKFLKISCIAFLGIALICEIFSYANGVMAQRELRRGPIISLLMQKYNMPDARSAFKNYATESRELCEMVYYHEQAKWFFALAFFSLFALIAHRLKVPDCKTVQNFERNATDTTPSTSTHSIEHNERNMSPTKIMWNKKKNDIIIFFCIVLIAILFLIFH